MGKRSTKSMMTSLARSTPPLWPSMPWCWSVTDLVGLMSVEVSFVTELATQALKKAPQQRSDSIHCPGITGWRPQDLTDSGYRFWKNWKNDFLKNKLCFSISASWGTSGRNWKCFLNPRRIKFLPISMQATCTICSARSACSRDLWHRFLSQVKQVENILKIRILKFPKADVQTDHVGRQAGRCQGCSRTDEGVLRAGWAPDQGTILRSVFCVQTDHVGRQAGVQFVRLWRAILKNLRSF